jgi:hypothetical protein
MSSPAPVKNYGVGDLLRNVTDQLENMKVGSLEEVNLFNEAMKPLVTYLTKMKSRAPLAVITGKIRAKRDADHQTILDLEQFQSQNYSSYLEAKKSKINKLERERKTPSPEGTKYEKIQQFIGNLKKTEEIDKLNNNDDFFKSEPAIKISRQITNLTDKIKAYSVLEKVVAEFDRQIDLISLSLPPLDPRASSPTSIDSQGRSCSITPRPSSTVQPSPSPTSDIEQLPIFTNTPGLPKLAPIEQSPNPL